MDVFFEEYMADELGTLERVYDCAGIALTEQARTEISDYQLAHPRGREGRVAYDLRGHFGVTPEEVRARFGAYLERLPGSDRGLMHAPRPGRPAHRHAPGPGAHATRLRRPGSPGRGGHLPLGRVHRRLPGAHRRRSGHRQHRHGVRGARTTRGSSTPSGPARRTPSSPPRPTWTTSVASTCSRTRAPGYIAQQNNQLCQADDARIRTLRMRTAGIWFDTLGTDARRIAAENPGVSMRQAEPVPDVTFDQLLELDVDGLRLELHAAVGETIDGAIVWLPERRTALISNLLRATLPAFPEPQHAAGGPLPLRRAVPGERPHGARPAPRDPHHRPP